MIPPMPSGLTFEAWRYWRLRECGFELREVRKIDEMQERVWRKDNVK